MRDPREINKINHLLSIVLPIVADVVRTILQLCDWQVKEEDCGLDLAFSIKKGEKEVKFYMHNLLLEIATIDRDENPLRFDERLRDFDYFLAKMVRILESKLRVLFHLFGEEDVDRAIENIAGDVEEYARIRIWRLDQNKSSRSRHRM